MRLRQRWGRVGKGLETIYRVMNLRVEGMGRDGGWGWEPMANHGVGRVGGGCGWEPMANHRVGRVGVSGNGGGVTEEGWGRSSMVGGEVAVVHWRRRLWGAKG
ncbi:hypothetical protein Acr_05g0001230 [Actinidia rufa]|uniref:Uncharacterized protein n=1 Tax=Actinidia rufa TaxID=165716 RepID=A0A7J0EJ39_9ERIC|nr:hypothetical protein Acr_05g0001230 [Actinidia rufa]